MYFFGWGFYTLGDDDTLEHKLTGQPAKTRTPHYTTTNTIGILSRGKPSGVLPQRSDGEGFYRSSDGNPEQEITFEPCDGDASSQTSHADKGGQCDGNRWATVRQWFSRVLLSPNIIATAIGVSIAMIAPLQKMLFDNPRATLWPLGAALEVRHCPQIAARRKYEDKVFN